MYVPWAYILLIKIARLGFVLLHGSLPTVLFLFSFRCAALFVGGLGWVCEREGGWVGESDSGAPSSPG